MPEGACTMTIDKFYAEINSIIGGLWAHPELGYREQRTSAVVEEFLHKHGRGLPIQKFSTTGLRIDVPSISESGKDIRRVAVIAELDAVICPAHPDADPETGAVHACGHHTQVGIALAIFAYLLGTGEWRDADINLSFVFVPAEEFVDLAYRSQLRSEGKITWFGGKPEAIMLGAFDGIDAAVCLHAIGGLLPEPTIEINCDLAGFLYKNIHFQGVASHAGFDPFAGANAFSMATLFTNALALGRQQLREDVLARMNPVITESTMTTNVVPHSVTIGTDVRSIDLDYLRDIAGRVDRAAHGCAQALGGEAQIVTEMGYLPFVQNRQMNEAIRATFHEDSTITRLIDDRGAIAAAGDAGDLSFIMPTIQLSYGGFDGTIHGKDFALIDPEHVLINVPRLLIKALMRMGSYLPNPVPRRSYSDYVATISQLAPVPEGAISSTRAQKRGL